MIKFGSSSLIIRNKKSGQSMHALTKTKVSEVVEKMLCFSDSVKPLT